jgi:hypothetical protein
MMNEGIFDSYEITTVGKIFLAGIAAAILGKASNMRVRGTPDEIAALKDALLASREFQEELRRPGATVQSIMDRLHLKNVSAEEFEKRLGVPWPL